MKSLEGKPIIELKDDSLAIPVSTTKSMPSLKRGSDIFGTNCLWRIMLLSVKTVFFSDKINLLLPCGPLAMLVNHLSHRQVSYVINIVYI